MCLVLTKGSQRDKDEQQRFLSTSPKSFRIKGVKDKGGTGCHIFASSVVGWSQRLASLLLWEGGSSQWVLKGSFGRLFSLPTVFIFLLSVCLSLY